MSDRNPLTWNKVGDAKVLDVTPKTESGRALLPQLNAWLPTTEVFGPNYNADRILAIEQEAARKAVAEVLERLEERVAIMKACAPDGDYIRWDVQHADVDLHYVNRSGVLALIASERKP